jgi:epoxyqueuosine reductase
MGLGLDAIGVTALEGGSSSKALQAFLEKGHHGDMDWMATTADRRGDPKALWPEARTAVMVGHSYAPKSDPRAVLDEPTRGAISVYAQGRDYHDVLKKRVKALASSLADASRSEVKVFVDTAPLMEKPLAQRAGLGWQGKHTNLVSRTHGSWLFLGAILTTAEIAVDAAELDHCGSCKRCLDACPTNAFPAPYQLDARRCLAYLTIEYRGHIDAEYRKALGNRIFGCDDCLAACPWNKFAAASHEMKYWAVEATSESALADILALDDAGFRKRFAGTPIKRSGRDRLVRNALIAAGNSGEADLVPYVCALLDDKSAIVRAMAVWAAGQLADADHLQELMRRHAEEETDIAVAAEWTRLREDVR